MTHSVTHLEQIVLATRIHARQHIRRRLYLRTSTQHVLVLQHILQRIVTQLKRSLSTLLLGQLHATTTLKVMLHLAGDSHARRAGLLAQIGVLHTVKHIAVGRKRSRLITRLTQTLPRPRTNRVRRVRIKIKIPPIMTATLYTACYSQIRVCHLIVGMHLLHHLTTTKHRLYSTIAVRLTRASRHGIRATTKLRQRFLPVVPTHTPHTMIHGALTRRHPTVLRATSRSLHVRIQRTIIIVQRLI